MLLQIYRLNQRHVGSDCYSKNDFTCPSGLASAFFIIKREGVKLRAVLFVGHGSKDAEGNEEVRKFVDSLSPKLEGIDVGIVEACFLEFELPTIAQGIDTCVQKGATQVILIPIILLPAGHSKIHIPASIDKAKEKYPNVQFSYGRPIGIHEKTIEILFSRLGELRSTGHTGIDNEQEETAILLVGRGSSDPDANSDLYKITRLLWEKGNAKWVETAFMGVTTPLVEEGVQRCLQLGAKKVIILPYFLFTGVLIKRLEDKLKAFQDHYPEREFLLANYFGYHPLLQEILKDRVLEALEGDVQMNCDTCQYRLAAMEHVDHHDHDHSHHHHHHL